MADELIPASGWLPVGDQVAGYRDVTTGDILPEPLRAENTALLRRLLGIAIGTLAVAALYFGKDVLVPITLAVILAFVLSPVVNWLQRARLWRAPSVIITVIAALGLIGGIGTLIGMQTASLSVNATQYAAVIETKVEALRGLATDQIETLSQSLVGKRPPKPPAPALREQPSASGMPAQETGLPRPVVVELAPQKTSPFEIARTILAPVIGPLETTFIVLIVAIFVLLQKEDLRDRFIRLFGSGDLHRTTLALDDAGHRLRRYFLAQLGINTAFGIIVTVGLWLLGVPSPALWGVLAGLCRFVPYIGAVLAAVGPIALGLAIDPGWSTAISIGIFFVVTEAVLGYVIEPMLYGHSTGLSPVSVIIAAIFWTWLWGPIGLIMSTPLTLCLVVMGRHVKALEFFEVLLGDRPALTPVESFYQRVLADNADEALAQAEAMLLERDLPSYYDSVVLEALKLAVVDQVRGTIDTARMERMTRTMMAVIDDLGHAAEYNELSEDGSPALAPTIVCMAGRGPFDDVVTSMLGQLLEQQGHALRIIPHRAATRSGIAGLELSGTGSIIISYLELTGSPAHLRFLIRRIRQSAPHAKIIVGLWPQGEGALSDATIQHKIGADMFVGSLTDAVAAVARHEHATADVKRAITI